MLVKLTNAPSAVMGMYRMYLASVFLLPMVLKHRGDFKKITKVNYVYLIIAGLFLALHFGLWFESLKLTTVTSSTVILSTQPIVALFGGFLIYKEKVDLKSFLTIIVSIIGVIIVSWGDLGGNNSLALLGDLLSFLSVIALVSYLLIGQAKIKNISFWIYSFIVFLVAGVFLNLFNLMTNTQMTGYSIYDWFMFVALAIFPTIAHVLYNYLLNFVSPTTISMSMLGEPIGATILAVIFLHQKVTALQILGGVIVLVGIYLFLKNQSKENQVT
ncbi:MULTISPECIES: DMT family transporter [Fructilactobacillus]|uniref:DMT family transporter n=2 Tax=Fructilactobacillus TaxID=2767881 RepID=A0A9Q8ZUQ1_9LACO|nr:MULTISPECIES: DMT family transporter [Fructilactobacillus]USS89954.1 DMT family transporter [Fructilactobacillus cliffordii]USS91391.1 DMT family transporter [Fructilactobacillus carniphilus]